MANKEKGKQRVEHAVTKACDLKKASYLRIKQLTVRIKVQA